MYNLGETLRESSIASLVREIVINDAYTLECMKRGIINYSELAKRVLDEIAKRYKVKPSLAAVKMALIRLSTKLENNYDDIMKIIAKSVLAVQDSVTLITVPREEIGKVWRTIASLGSKSRFIQVTQSLGAATVVIAEEDADEILNNVNNVLEIIDKQSVIILVSPKEIVRTPGVVAFITGYLSNRGVNITQVISSYVDTLIVLNSEDAARAYSMLHNLIESAKERFLKSRLNNE